MLVRRTVILPAPGCLTASQPATSGWRNGVARSIEMCVASNLAEQDTHRSSISALERVASLTAWSPASGAR